MNRILTRVQATRAGNCKKVAQYCQKELKRSATKNGRLSKDVQSKARRAQREASSNAYSVPFVCNIAEFYIIDAELLEKE